MHLGAKTGYHAIKTRTNLLYVYQIGTIRLSHIIFTPKSMMTQEYWVTPTMGVYYDAGKTAFPTQLPTNVDSDGDITVELFFLTPKVWKVKDLIAMTYNDDDIQKIWNKWGKPF